MNRYFLSQPHQPFFTLGIINGLLFMFLFIFSYKGFFPINAKFLHSFSMIFLVFTNFFFGFLYTTFPRFSQTPPIPAKFYLLAFTFNLLATLLFLIGIWFEEALHLSILLLMVSFTLTLKIFYNIYLQITLPKKDQYWIIVALGVGFLSLLLFLLYLLPCNCNVEIFYHLGVNFGIYLYLVFLAFVVAFRMVPFFSYVMDWKKNERLHFLIFTLFLFRSFLFTLYPKALFLFDLVGAILIGYELKKIKLPFKKEEPLLWILHLAIYWLVAGLFLGAIIEFFEEFKGWYSFSLPLHLLVLGFLTTILIGFGTRVILGHSRNILKVDKKGVILFYFTQIVVIGRVLFSLAASAGKITPTFEISATLWLVLLGMWLFRYGDILIFGVKR